MRVTVVTRGRQDAARGFTDNSTTVDHVLTVDVDAPSPYDSMVSLMALVEALVANLVDRLGETSRRRLSALERVRETYTKEECESPS